MSSSDSDDDMYSNYVEKRKALVNKKKVVVLPDSPESSSPQKVECVSSDDDCKILDDVVVAKKAKKRRIYSDDEDDDFFVSPVVTSKKTHSQYLEDKKKQAAQNYASDIQTKNTDDLFEVFTKEEAKSAPIGALDRAYRLCNSLDDEDEIVQIDTLKTPANKRNRPSRRSASPSTPGLFPVTIDVTDMEIFSNGRVRFEVHLTDDFDDVRMSFAEKWGCEVEEVALRFKNDIIGEFETPKGLGFTPLQIPHPCFDAYKLQTLVAASTADLSIGSTEKQTVLEEAESEVLNLKVQSKSWRKPIDVRVEKTTTVKELRDIVSKMMAENVDGDIVRDGGRKTRGAGKNVIRLMFDDNYLQDDKATIGSLDIEDDDCIDVY